VCSSFVFVVLLVGKGGGVEGPAPNPPQVLLEEPETRLLDGGNLYYQIAAKPCSPQYWNFVKDSTNIPSGTTMPDFPEHHPP
jgi:hypothetical protein